MKRIKGGICAPFGFKASGIACGIKVSGKPDLALIYSEVPAAAAGVFTTNQVKAAPVLVSQKQIKTGVAQAIIANAGNANCWTGGPGMRDAWQMVADTAGALKIPAQNVLVTSTGVIGKPMPMPKIRAGIKKIGRSLSKTGSSAAARAIMTTDLLPKEIAVKVGKITIGAIAKGSGMIAPGMATMHAFITTDAEIDQRLLQKILRQAVAKTFNMVSVDNCMSTNDCVIALANGMSGVQVGTGFTSYRDTRYRDIPVRLIGQRQALSLHSFQKAFEYVCEYLAKAMAADGEGATRLLTVKVSGAQNDADARAVAKALINSFLLKAAVYGRDKNTGRILQAVGITSAKVDWNKFRFNWKMGDKEDIISVNLGMGKSFSVGWGCDLTEGYVRINAKYRT